MEFSYIALTISPILAGESDEENEGGNVDTQNIMKRIFSKKNKAEFKVGNPLPNNGACKHSKNSHRYFRFPCCGKAFACDDCHNKVEKHDMERAHNMICGFCSAEQPVSAQCRKCAKMTVKISTNTGYWEGGKGTRNRNAMSSKDNHKYAGLGKTISNKKRAELSKKKK